MTENIYAPHLVTIKEIRDETRDVKTFTLAFRDTAVGEAFNYRPGQFVEITVFGVGEAPISITSSPTRKGTFQLAVRAVGNVTRALHQLDKGATIGARGPFGNGFPIDKFKNKDVLIVGGGIGLVPLRSVINYMRDKRTDFGRLIVLFGCRAPLERIFCDELHEWSECENMEFIETVDTADESWAGNVGVITTLFPKITFDPSNTYAVVVGPPIMYRFAIAECIKKGIPEDQIILSLERRMECGVGKCGHCQINNVYVCQDGPVFTYAEVKKLQEAV